MSEKAKLGEAAVSIRADFSKLDGDLNKVALQVSKTLTAVGKPIRDLGVVLTAGLTVPLTAIIVKSALAATRVNELALVNQVLGKNSGIAAREVTEATEAVRKQGIEADVANKTIAEFIKANLKIADAAKIARVAQDAAVISGKNSTEVTNTLTEAIIVGNLQLFKSAGVLLDLEDAYDTYGKTIGKTGRQLTEEEKTQARVNATLEYGVRIQGAYLAAMADPGKVLRSYPRYLDDIAVAVGQSFVPAFTDAIFAGQKFLKEIKEMVSEGGKLYPTIQKVGKSLSDLVGKLILAADWFLNLDPAILATIADLLVFLAAAGPVLIVVGQLSLSVGKAIPGFIALAKAVGMTAPALIAATGPAALLIAALLGIAIGTIAVANASKINEEEAKATQKTMLLTTKTYEEYVAQVQAAAAATGDMIISSSNADRASTAFVKTIVLLTQEEWDQQQATEKLNAEWAIRDEMQAKAMSQTPTMEDVIADETAALKLQEIAMARLNTMIGGELGKSTKEYTATMGELETRMGEVKTRIGELIEKKEKQGGWLGSKDREELEDLQEEFKNVATEIIKTAEAHEEATARIIYGILAQQIALLGLPFEDTMALLGGVAESWGLIDEETKNAWDSTAQLLDDYATGKITIDEFVTAMGNIKDKTVVIDVEVRGISRALALLSANGELMGAIKPGGDAVYMWGSGGHMDQGEAGIVGDEGPELFIPGASGMLIPNDRLLDTAGKHSGYSPVLGAAKNDSRADWEFGRIVSAIEGLPLVMKLALREAVATLEIR